MPLRVGIVALMAIGSAVMWIGLPVGLIYLASKVTDTTQPRLGPYLIVIIGLPIGMALVGKGLGALDRAYLRLCGEPPQRYRPGWTRSLRGERTSGHRWTMLDRVMLVSVLVCLLAMGIWFLFFAGSPLPAA